MSGSHYVDYPAFVGETNMRCHTSLSNEALRIFFCLNYRNNFGNPQNFLTLRSYCFPQKAPTNKASDWFYEQSDAENKSQMLQVSSDSSHFVVAF